MKYRIFSIAVGISLLLQSAVFSVSAEDLHCYGDIDNNHIINIYDLCLLKQGLLRPDSLTSVQRQAADLNGDGQVNVQDVSILQDYLLAKTKTFPVGGSFAEVPENTHIYQDGTYQASAFGYDGTVYVTVTIENDTITNITAYSEESDEWYFEQACDTVISRILNAQNTNVDAASGATYSSQAIMSAVKKALNSAKV